MTRALVLRSLEDESGQRCVDILRLADGTISLQEFRRDPEDPRGWAATGWRIDCGCVDAATAEREAVKHCPWLMSGTS